MSKKSYNSYRINFPPALPEEKQLLLLSKLPDEQAKKDLIEGNLRLVAYIAKKYSNNEELEDLISIGTIGLIKAINAYNPEKRSKLATFATRCIENEILMYFRKQSKYLNNTLSINTIITYDLDGKELYLEDIIEDTSVPIKLKMLEEIPLLFSCLNTLCNTISYRNLIILLYGIGGKTKEFIGNTIGISRSFVSRLYNRHIKQLISIINSPNNNTYNSNFTFHYKDTSSMYVVIDKSVFNSSYELTLLPHKETNKSYIFTLPLEQNSFIEIAEMLLPVYLSHKNLEV